jgi:hypothetical protein
MLLLLLEPVLINDLNLDMVFKLGGLEDIGRVILEQPMPSEINKRQAQLFKFNE